MSGKTLLVIAGILAVGYFVFGIGNKKGGMMGFPFALNVPGANPANPNAPLPSTGGKQDTSMTGASEYT